MKVVAFDCPHPANCFERIKIKEMKLLDRFKDWLRWKRGEPFGSMAIPWTPEIEEAFESAGVKFTVLEVAREEWPTECESWPVENALSMAVA